MPSHVQFRTEKSNPDMPGVQDIDPKEVWENKAQITIVDVRRPNEWTDELGHIPGAKHIVLDTLPEHLGELPRNETIVFVCRSGGRSGRATAFAQQNGFTNVFNMRGGMMLWNELGLEVEGRND